MEIKYFSCLNLIHFCCILNRKLRIRFCSSTDREPLEKFLQFSCRSRVFCMRTSHRCVYTTKTYLTETHQGTPLSCEIIQSRRSSVMKRNPYSGQWYSVRLSTEKLGARPAATEWFAAALLGQERSHQLPRQKQISGFVLPLIADTQNQI